MVDLDAVIRRARSATVRRDAAEAYVRELERSTDGSSDLGWSRTPDELRRPSWLAPTLAIAAVVVVVSLAAGLLLTPRGQPPPLAAVRIGERVAIVAEPGTVYRIVRASGDETAIEVERGEVTARLWPGTHAHRLTLQGGGVVALAQGTVYSLAVERGTGAVHVDEGTVEVRIGAEVHRVPAGASWPPDRPRASGRSRAPVLTALPTPDRRSLAPSASPTPSPSPTASASPTPSPLPGASPSIDIASPALQRATPDLKGAPSQTIKKRWQLARRLRAEGKLRMAIAECIAIADLHDATWSPIALVEALRLYGGPLADPALAVAIADRTIAEWPADVLVPEARALRCRALARLGRGQECDLPPVP
ncbi:MAG TPA: hypothetical protein VLM79_10500 [Kofleriaceae bacterium]|nr:hypothetical protein [Kofleriaceae bacterium]